jgi:hypothetical protein
MDVVSRHPEDNGIMYTVEKWFEKHKYPFHKGINYFSEVQTEGLWCQLIQLLVFFILQIASGSKLWSYVEILRNAGLYAICR